MKNWLSLVLVAFFAVPCNGLREARTGMDRAESCMKSSPDSALMIIRGIEGSTLPSRSLRARHALLLTMAQDKCYIDVKEDSTIRVAYDFFQRHGSKWDRLLSTYYLGVIRQNAENYIEAALAFRDAEPLAIDLGDNRQLSLIYQHLSRIFALNYDHVRSLDYAEKALDAAERAGEKEMADFCKYDVAMQLMREYRYKEAESLMAQIISDDTSPGLRDMARLLLAEAVLFKGASAAELQRIKALYQGVLSAHNIPLSSHDFGMLAVLSEKEGDSMLADDYLAKAEERLRTSVDSSVFFNDCRNVYDLRGDWERAHVAKSKSVITQDQMIIELLGQSLTHSLESYYEDKLAKEQIMSRIRLWRYCAIAFFLMLVSGIIIIVVRRRNQQVLEDMIKTQEVSYELIGTLVSDKVNSLQRLSEAYFSWDDKMIKRKEEKDGKMLPDDIISMFRKQLNELRSDRSFITALERSLDLNEDGLMSKAHAVLGKEKDLDNSVLVLLFSGFSIKSISYLLRMSEPSLRMRKTRYKQQFECLPEPEQSVLLKKLGY